MATEPDHGWFRPTGSDALLILVLLAPLAAFSCWTYIHFIAGRFE